MIILEEISKNFKDYMSMLIYTFGNDILEYPGRIFFF